MIETGTLSLAASKFGLSALLFLFLAAWASAQSPRVDSIDPAQGSITGGTLVRISGANLADATVTLDKTAVTPTALSSTEIRLQMPPHDNGIARISVRTSAGVGYGEFLYLPPRLGELPPGYITTVAGIGSFSGDGRVGTKAVVDPTNFALDSSGGIYVEEAGESRVRRIRPDGIIEPFAGTDAEGFSGDGGPATEASLWQPRGIDLGPNGNVYIADSFSHRIRRVDTATGIITTIAGGGPGGASGGAFSGDGGPASEARFNFPNQVAVDKDGSIFILDSGNYRVRRIAPDGTISTFAGTGTPGFSGDGGPATRAQFDSGGIFVDAGGLAVDPAGNLYLADSNNNRVRRIDRQAGIITTVVLVNNVRAVSTDSSGIVYCASTHGSADSRQILRVSGTGAITASWGKGSGFSEDGSAALDAPLGFIERVKVDPAGNLLFTEESSGRLRRINVATGLLETVAGIGPRLIGEMGPAIAASLNNFNGDLAFQEGGELLIADSGNERLRQIDVRGNIRTFAGDGFFGFPNQDDVPALETSLTVNGIATDRRGNLLIVDGFIVRMIDVRGVIRPRAGKRNPQFDFSGDGGPATEAVFDQPFDLTVDAAGNLFVADTNNNRVRRVDSRTGIITTVAGSGPVNGFERYGRGTSCGDGGPAVQACVNTPYGVAVDAQGNLFISENWERIRRVDPNGTITTFATVYATKLRLDAAGNLFAVAADRVVRISPDGILTTIAGRQGMLGFSGDNGPALQATIRAQGQASGLAIDREGNLFFSDGGNRRIRAVRFGAVLAPPGARVEANSGTPQSAPSGAPFAAPLEVTVSDPSGFPAPGVRVDFSAPASGSSCVFANGSNVFSALTDRLGRARATGTAGCQAGSYVVTAVPLSSSVLTSFDLTNATTAADNPAPVLRSRAPIAAQAGGEALTLTFNGSNFLPCSVIRWNGSDRPTIFLGVGQLKASITASDVAAPGTALITAFNPAPGGGSSNVLVFNIVSSALPALLLNSREPPRRVEPRTRP